MGYSINEEVVLVGRLPPGSTVTISLLDLKTDNYIEITIDECIESEKAPGIFTWSTRFIQEDAISGYSKLYYNMEREDGIYNDDGLITIGGYVDKAIEADLSELGYKADEIQEILEIINSRI